MANKSPKIMIKRGDDFRLDMTIQDLNNDTAILAKQAQTDAQYAYDAALVVVPPDPVALAAALVTLDAAKAAYLAAITVDVSTWTITSKIAWCGKLIDPLTVVILDAPNGRFSLQASSVLTALWKPRTHEADIQFVRSAGKISSQTFDIIVERDITNG